MHDPDQNEEFEGMEDYDQTIGADTPCPYSQFIEDDEDDTDWWDEGAYEDDED